METIAFRIAVSVLTALGLLAVLPTLPERSFGASETVSEAYPSVPSTIPSPPRTGPEPAHLQDVLQATVSSCEDALRLALKVGWPEELLAHLGRIMWRESACKEWAFNKDDGWNGSRGLLQINGAHLRRTPWAPGGWLQAQGIGIRGEDDLFNAELNLRAGLTLYRFAERYYGDGWQPWNATRDRD